MYVRKYAAIPAQVKAGLATENGEALGKRENGGCHECERTGLLCFTFEIRNESCPRKCRASFSPVWKVEFYFRDVVLLIFLRHLGKDF